MNTPEPTDTEELTTPLEQRVAEWMTELGFEQTESGSYRHTKHDGWAIVSPEAIFFYQALQHQRTQDYDRLKPLAEPKSLVEMFGDEAAPMYTDKSTDQIFQKEGYIRHCKEVGAALDKVFKSSEEES